MLRELNTNEMEMVSGGNFHEDPPGMFDQETMGLNENMYEQILQAFGIWSNSSSDEHHEDYEITVRGTQTSGTSSTDGTSSSEPYDACANAQNGVAIMNEFMEAGAEAMTAGPGGLIIGAWLGAFGIIGIGPATYGVYRHC